MSAAVLRPYTLLVFAYFICGNLFSVDSRRLFRHPRPAFASESPARPAARPPPPPTSAVSRDARRTPCDARRERRPQPAAHDTGTDRGRRDREPVCCHCAAGFPQLHTCPQMRPTAYAPAAAASPEGIGFLLATWAHARGDASAARRPRAVGKRRRHRSRQRPSHRVLRPAVVAQGARDSVQALGGLRCAAREGAGSCDRDGRAFGRRGWLPPITGLWLEGAAAGPEWPQRAANNYGTSIGRTHARTHAPWPHAGTTCSSARECRRPRCAPPRARPSAPRASQSSTSTPPGCPASPGWAARSLSARCCSRRSIIRCFPRCNLPCHACPVPGKGAGGGRRLRRWGAEGVGHGRAQRRPEYLHATHCSPTRAPQVPNHVGLSAAKMREQILLLRDGTMWARAVMSMPSDGRPRTKTATYGQRAVLTAVLAGILAVLWWG